MDGDSIRVTRSLALPLREIELRTSRSSGPGGQHAQKSETRVEAVFEVEASATLSDAQERLADQLRRALRVERRRVATRPTEASRERRLEEKRRRSAVKRLRSPPED
jgi:ribosome-associated protein